VKNWGKGRGNNLLSTPPLGKTSSRPELQQGRDSSRVGELLQSHGSRLCDEVRWLEAEGGLRESSLASVLALSICPAYLLPLSPCCSHPVALKTSTDSQTTLMKSSTKSSRKKNACLRKFQKSLTFLVVFNR